VAWPEFGCELQVALHSVLQGEDSGALLYERTDGRDGMGVVVGFYGVDDEVYRPNLGWVASGWDINRKLGTILFQPQAVGLDGAEMLAAGDQGDVVSSTGQQGPQAASDSTRTHDGDTHQ